MKLPLSGIIPPVVTPLIDNNTLDVKGLEKLIEHLLSGGVHGLFLLGTTGEATSLNYDLRKELIKRTSQLVNHRVPIVVGITDTHLDGTRLIADYSAQVGIDAVVLASPYYLPISQEEMRDYLEIVVPKLPLPCILYNIPGCTKINLSVETVRKARELGAIGIKDSSGDMSLLISLIREFKSSPEFSVLVGTELFLPDAILHGGHGGIVGGANMFPRLFVDLYQASVDRNLEKMALLFEKVQWINSTIYQVGKHASRMTKGTKCALSVMNICDDFMALPLRRHGIEERRKIEHYIAEMREMLS
jgi:2-dehydro-3-deoxy-D-pentonate aldolase